MAPQASVSLCHLPPLLPSAGTTPAKTVSGFPSGNGPGRVLSCPPSPGDRCFLCKATFVPGLLSEGLGARGSLALVSAGTPGNSAATRVAAAVSQSPDV